MKAYKDFTNTDKAKLLFDLFPEELSQFIDHLMSVCDDLENRKDDLSKSWNSGFITFEFWLSLSHETHDILRKRGYDMKKSSKIFSDQLFHTYTSLFVNDRIIKYAQVNGNPTFRIAVSLLYES